MLVSTDTKKVFRIFIKCFFKYLLILLIVLIMMLLFLALSYSLAKKLTIDKNTVKLHEGVAGIEMEIKRMEEIGQVLLSEKEYMSLMLLKGNPQPSNYYDITSIQKRFVRLCATLTYVTDGYILFKENPIFLSKFFSSDKYTNIYPSLRYTDNKSPDNWYNESFVEPFTVRLEHTAAYFNKYCGSDIKEGILCSINNSYHNSISNSSIIACFFEKNDIINALLYEDYLDQSFVYLTNADSEIILSHNFPKQEPLTDVAENDSINLEGISYIVLKSATSSSGITAVSGVSLNRFRNDISCLINLVYIYIFIGFLGLICISLSVSIRETVRSRQILNIASSYAEPSGEAKKPSVDRAIQRIDSIGKEQRTHLNQLNSVIRNCILENLFLQGVYTTHEEKKLLSYFDQNFEFYCVTIFSFSFYEEDNINARFGEQNFILKTEAVLQEMINQDYLSFFFNPSEMVLIVFFQDSDNCDIHLLQTHFLKIVDVLSQKMEPYPSVSVGLSRIVTGLKNMHLAYLQAKDVVSVNETRDKNGVYVYNTPHSVVGKKTVDISLLDKCFNFVLQGDAENIVTILDEILNNFSKLSRSNEDQLQLYFSLRQPIYNAFLEITSHHGEDFNIEFPHYVGSKNIQEHLHLLKDFAVALCRQMESFKKNSSELLKTNVINYIYTSFADINLTVSSIAEHFSISEKYVSVLVKDRLNKNLSKFIEEIRIEKAEELLLTTDLSNAAIGRACGFGSDNTFYRAFSKKHGVSPNIWRKNNLNML